MQIIKKRKTVVEDFNKKLSKCQQYQVWQKRALNKLIKNVGKVNKDSGVMITGKNHCVKSVQIR